MAISLVTQLWKYHLTTSDANDEWPVHDIDEQTKHNVRLSLVQYREQLGLGVYTELAHGVTVKIIDQIVKKLAYISCATDIINKVDIWSVEHASNMFKIISAVLHIEGLEEEYVEDDD